MSTTVQTMLDRLNDKVQNYTTGAIDLGNRMRSLTESYEYVQTKLTLPSDKVTYRFYYSQDTMFYDAPSDFNEPLLLIYDDYSKNKPDTNWSWTQDTDILERTGLKCRDKNWSTTTVNGKMQILMGGSNLYQGSIVSTFDSINGITVSGDANTPTIDTNVKYEGTGSLKFNITPSSGTATVKLTLPSMDWSAWHTNMAFLNMRVFMPSVAFSSINLKIGSSPTDYYTFTATTQSNGTPLSINNFNLVTWKFSDNPTITGSPNDKIITFGEVDFVLTGAFSTPVTGFHLDNFYSTIPDYMDLIYLSNNKGTLADGVTKIQQFTLGTDIPSFSSIAPDLINPVVYRAAYILYPQLRKEPEFWAMYKAECTDVMKDYGRIYPRQRIITYGHTHLLRR